MFTTQEEGKAKTLCPLGNYCTKFAWAEQKTSNKEDLGNSGN